MRLTIGPTVGPQARRGVTMPPERMGGIKRLGGEIADKAFERLLAAGSRQPRALDVMRNVEVRVVAPVDAGRPVLDPLPVSTIGQKPVRQLGLQPVDGDRTFQYPDAEDDHPIGRPVHAQPGRVDWRHALAVAHFSLPGFFRVITLSCAHKKLFARTIGQINLRPSAIDCPAMAKETFRDLLLLSPRCPQTI